jgi:hypothetical protein
MLGTMASEKGSGSAASDVEVLLMPLCGFAPMPPVLSPTIYRPVEKVGRVTPTTRIFLN